MNGTFTIELFRKGSGEVNETTVSITGNATLTFLNMTPGSYMAELVMIADNGNRSIEDSKFGIKSQVGYGLTTKDASNRTRCYFKSSEAVYLDISPSVPAGSSIIMVAPDGSRDSLPSSSTVTLLVIRKSNISSA